MYLWVGVDGLRGLLMWMVHKVTAGNKHNSEANILDPNKWGQVRTAKIQNPIHMTAKLIDLTSV